MQGTTRNNRGRQVLPRPHDTRNPRPQHAVNPKGREEERETKEDGRAWDKACWAVRSSPQHRQRRPQRQSAAASKRQRPARQSSSKRQLAVVAQASAAARQRRRRRRQQRRRQWRPQRHQQQQCQHHRRHFAHPKNIRPFVRSVSHSVSQSVIPSPSSKLRDVPPVVARVGDDDNDGDAEPKAAAAAAVAVTAQQRRRWRQQQPVTVMGSANAQHSNPPTRGGKGRERKTWRVATASDGQRQRATVSNSKQRAQVGGTGSPARAVEQRAWVLFDQGHPPHNRAGTGSFMALPQYHHSGSGS